VVSSEDDVSAICGVGPRSIGSASLILEELVDIAQSAAVE